MDLKECLRKDGLRLTEKACLYAVLFSDEPTPVSKNLETASPTVTVVATAPQDKEDQGSEEGAAGKFVCFVLSLWVLLQSCGTKVGHPKPVSGVADRFTHFALAVSVG